MASLAYSAWSQMMLELQSDPSGTVDAGDRKQLLQHILASRHFRKSPRVSEFLTYICERAFSNRCNEISEQQIAVHVFGRPTDYNSAEDTIVRTTARQVRQKLELFHLDEGAGSLWRLTIPKGSYVPLFEKVEDAAADEAIDSARTARGVTGRIAGDWDWGFSGLS